MQAAPHREEIIQPAGRLLVGQFMICDQGVSLRTESGRVLKTHVVLQLCSFALSIIPLFAGNLACAASNALGNVNER